MSAPTEEHAPTEEQLGRDDRLLRLVTETSANVVVVAAWFAGLGLVGAVIWDQVTPLAHFTRAATNGTMGEDELARQFGATGWFFLIAAVGGLLSGIVLLLLRRRSPIVMVVLVAAGGALATWVMKDVGLHLGPGDPNAALATAQLGDKVPIQLRTDAHGVYFVWSIAALLGGIVALWLQERRANRLAAREDRTASSPVSPFGAYPNG